MKIYLELNVPDGWEKNLSMQPTIEAEIKADRWAWHSAEDVGPLAPMRAQVKAADEGAFAMAAGQCIHAGRAEGGLLSDDGGNQYCGKHSLLKHTKALLQTMIVSATQIVERQGSEDVVVGYRIKTGALHQLMGALGLWAPANMPTERA